ncbi:Hypothetical Protein FCC1311_086082 [Hondaea fermentalgiana]|uniref:Uncharacterized protein n=1 Tax=Hondaea fermentalgiana TaxID=2315210 RepID=A0A2R5GUP4_9STRA|nr:Hypothetical Protein FCC1311_086082 [Hondaea fermentalgiana]|eukprot:GBG32383.1 Hypothetical Protein FCC1311_086082 [Hondaea fermentalgiana]
MELDQTDASRVLKDLVYAYRAENEASLQPLEPRTLRWFYALLARIDLPLSVGMQSHLRDLLRVLEARRNAVLGAEDDDASDVPSDVVVYLLHDHFGCIL